MLTILIRIFLIYTILLITMRVMGKRQIGEMQVSELVTTILLSELAAQPIADDRIPLVFAVIPIGALISIEVILSYAVTKLPFLKPIFDGKPSILINRGQICTDEMLKVRISLEELLSQLRVAGVPDISDVEYAILEHNGQLSVIQKKPAMPPTIADLKLEIKESGIAHAVIVDSKVSEYDLTLIGKDRRWLDSRLKKRNAALSDVLLFTIDDAGKENLILRKCAHS